MRVTVNRKEAAARSSGGIGILGMLGVLFIGLKLTDHIDWSWWWVLAPFWIGPLIIILLFVLVAGLAAAVDR